MTATDDFIENLLQNRFSELSALMRGDIDLFVLCLDELQGGSGFPNINSDRVLGRDTPGFGPVEELTVSGGLEFTGTGTLQTSAFTGDVTKPAGGTALTIPAASIDFAKVQNIATDRLVGRDTAGSGSVEEIALNATLEFTGAGTIQRAALTGDVTAPAGSNATTLAAGVRASTTEVLTGTNTSKLVTPDALAALWELNLTPVASAATITLGEGGFFTVTGTTTITDIDFSVNGPGRIVWLRFTGILTITHSSTLVLPNGVNIITKPDDILCFISEFGGDTVYCLQPSFASRAEVLAGIRNKLVTANALGALWESAPNVASAATITLGDGAHFEITGTTTIIDIDFTDTTDGRLVWLKFAASLTLTHNATTLILPTGANIVTQAGDICAIKCEGGDNVRCISYLRADGTPISGIATQAEQETGTSLVKTVTPGRQHFHPSAAKCWGMATVAAGVPTLQVSYNITSITDTALGQITWTIATDFSTANWCFQGTIERASTSLAVANIRNTAIRSATQAAGTIVQECWDDTATTHLAADPASWHMAGFGDHV
jgi:hypothetical protein